MNKGYCKLCGKHEDLCNESHIIQNSLYKYIKSHCDRILYVDSAVGKSQVRQTGEFEGGILCLGCENRLSKLEGYGKEIIYGVYGSSGKTLNFQLRTDGTDEFSVSENDKGYDYKRFKLFLLSILWRASISSRPFFAKIKLDKNVEGEIRQMILNDNPGEEYDYPCTIILPPLEKNGSGEVMFNPVSAGFTISPWFYEESGIGRCSFVIQGARYIFLIDKTPGRLKSLSVKENKLTLVYNRPVEFEKLLKIMAVDLNKVGLV